MSTKFAGSQIVCCQRSFFITLACLVGVINVPAAVLYVDANSASPTPPYTNWVTAATNIQDAVDAAAAGDQILVTNGVYQTGGKADMFGVTNCVAVDKTLVLASVNGPSTTVINGSGVMRCVYLANSSRLTGFTLTNGFAGPFFAGGGVAFDVFGASGSVSNCVIVGCVAKYGGSAGPAGPIYGYIPLGGTLINCILRSNSAGHADFNIPGVGGGAYGTTLNNCTLIGNSAAGLGGGGGASSSKLQNCTLAGNSASGSGGGAVYSDLLNCIAYYNSEPNHLNCSVAYSCTTPAFDGSNITNAPTFVNTNYWADLRLQAGSLCIDAGTNLSGILTNDLDGRPRPLDGNADGVAAFDMGAYEHAVLFVRQDSPNPTPPYLSWSTAATNIQDAVDAAMAVDEVLVTNGVYAFGGGVSDDGVTYSRVVLSKALNVRSVNGPQVTIIQGGGEARCAYPRLL
jgi:hypothetical protein